MAEVKRVAKKKPQIEKVYCRKCMKMQAVSNYFEATNPFIDSNGWLSVCKECCGKIYNHYFAIYGNMKDAIDYTCRDLDIRFSEPALQQTQTQVENAANRGKKTKAVFGIYKSKLSSTGKRNEGYDQLRYKDSDRILHSVDKDTDTLEMKDDYVITNETIKYWGKGKTAWEYGFLDEEMTKIQTSFECPDYGMEMLMRDICFINLDIEKIRQGTESGDVNKLIESRSKLMNDANMKPVQSTGADANDQVTFGTLIKKWENEEPIPVTLDDEMKEYIDTYMVGHLAKMEGLRGDVVDKYEEAIKEYIVDISENSADGDYNGGL